jgi:hypothetical protein
MFIPLDQVRRHTWGVGRIDLPILGRRRRSAWRPQMQKHRPQIQPEELTPEQKSRLQTLENCFD